MMNKNSSQALAYPPHPTDAYYGGMASCSVASPPACANSWAKSAAVAMILLHRGEGNQLEMHQHPDLSSHVLHPTSVINQMVASCHQHPLPRCHPHPYFDNTQGPHHHAKKPPFPLSQLLQIKQDRPHSINTFTANNRTVENLTSKNNEKISIIDEDFAFLWQK